MSGEHFDRTKKIDDDPKTWAAAADLLNSMPKFTLDRDLTVEQSIDVVMTVLMTIACQYGWTREMLHKYWDGSIDVTFDGMAKMLIQERERPS